MDDQAIEPLRADAGADNINGPIRPRTPRARILISVAAGYGSHGEPVRRIRNKTGRVSDLWLAGSNLKPEKILSAEIKRRYAPRQRHPVR